VIRCAEPREVAIQWQSRRFYPDLYGGLEVQGWELARVWRQLGRHVSVITENYPDGPFRMDTLPDGIPCLRISPVRRAWPWSSLPWLRTLHWARFQRRLAQPHQVVIASYPECVIASRLACPRRPVINNCVAVSAALAAAGVVPRPGGPQQALERLAPVLADRVTVTSRMVKRQLLDLVNLPPGKIHVLPNGVDFDRSSRARPDGDLLELRSRGFFVPIYIGRLSVEKGVDLALRAVARMAHRARTRFIIVGEGPHEPALRRLARQLDLTRNVVFLGKLDHPEGRLAAADALVLPSRYESFGIVLLEAMAAGVPTLTWRTDYPRAPVACSEIIVEGRTGLCADAFDIDDLARKLDFLAERPDLRRRFGQAGRAHCRNNYSWVARATGFLNLIQTGEPISQTCPVSR